MNTETLARLPYMTKAAHESALHRLDLSIQRAERLAEELKRQRDRLVDDSDAYAKSDVLCWALNECMNFTRNLDPDTWAKNVADLKVVETLRALSAE